MAEYKYVVTSNTGDLAEKEFTDIKDALEYAKQAMDTFIYEYSADANVDETDDFDCVWSWDDIWDNDEEVISRIERGHSAMSDVEDDIDEAFKLSIEKNGDSTRIETSGDEAQEIVDFARAVLGDNFDVFDQDFADAVEVTDTEVEPAEFDYEIDATKEVDTDVDPFENDVFSEDEEDEGSEKPVEPSDTEESTKDSEEDDEYVPEDSKELVAEVEKTSADETPKDMIDGKLVDAKDPTESEVEVEEDEDLEECTTAEFVNEDTKELKGDLKLAAEADADYKEAELRRGEEQYEAEQEAREEAAEETPAEIAIWIDAVLDAWDLDDSEWPEPEDLDSLPKEGEEIPMPDDEDVPPIQEGFSNQETTRLLDAARKLGLETMGDIDQFAAEHGGLTDQDLLAELESEAAEVEKANRPFHDDEHKFTIPSGDEAAVRAAYARALKEANRNNKPYCFGFSGNYVSFRAFDKPIALKDEEKDIAKLKAEFKDIYIAYPGKSFEDQYIVEELTDGLFPASSEDTLVEEDDMSDEEFAEAFGKALADKRRLKEEDEEEIDDEDFEEEDLEDIELVEHVNEENDPIESDQELQGTDNAVNACKVNKVITHADDEKPLNENK